VDLFRAHKGPAVTPGKKKVNIKKKSQKLTHPPKQKSQLSIPLMVEGFLVTF